MAEAEDDARRLSDEKDAAVDTRLDDTVLKTLQTEGYVLVEGFLDTEQVTAAQAHLEAMLPTFGQSERDNAKWINVGDSPKTHFTITQFPAIPCELHLNVLSAELLDFAKRFCGTEDIVLDQSAISAKYAGHHIEDQDLHTDFTNHSLAWAPSDYLAGMIYYTDVTPENGPTRAVSWRHTVDTPMVPRDRTREEDPALYEHEVALTAPAGTLLLYTMRTFHRGSAMTGEGVHRFNHHFCHRTANVEHMGWSAWPVSGKHPEMARLMQMCNVEQRTAMGFPRPGSTYWTAEALDGVAARYPEMDVSPYREAAR
ncbi:MAG: ectoine hydroxylase-related dioxygenase (phytanoyl-CoA dioxygenase family) [Glaciecola sp.]